MICSAFLPALLFVCAVHSYNDTGVALLRPLAPGDPTWPELLQAAEEQKAAEASAEAALAAVTQVITIAMLPTPRLQFEKPYQAAGGARLGKSQ